MTTQRPYASPAPSLAQWLSRQKFWILGLIGVSIVVSLLTINFEGSPTAVYSYQGLVSTRDPQYGKPDSRVSIVLMKDFYCSACRSNETDVNTVFDNYKDRVKFVLKPVDVHKGATLDVAKAVLAAGKQGKAKEFSTEIYVYESSELTLKKDFIMDEIAKKLSLNLKQFNEDRSFDPEIQQVLNFGEQDVKNTVFNGGYDQQATDAAPGTKSKPKGVGIEATPTIAILKDNVVVSWWSGAQSASVINARVEAVLETL